MEGYCAARSGEDVFHLITPSITKFVQPHWYMNDIQVWCTDSLIMTGQGKYKGLDRKCVQVPLTTTNSAVPSAHFHFHYCFTGYGVLCYLVPKYYTKDAMAYQEMSVLLLGLFLITSLITKFVVKDL